MSNRVTIVTLLRYSDLSQNLDELSDEILAKMIARHNSKDIKARKCEPVLCTFDDGKISLEINISRQYFSTKEDAERVLELMKAAEKPLIECVYKLNIFRVIYYVGNFPGLETDVNAFESLSKSSVE
jgi:hypothetical protein